MKGKSAAVDTEGFPDCGAAHNDHGYPKTSLFDDSVDNFFRVIDKISVLCGEAVCNVLSEEEIELLSSSITFLREWRYFKYPDRYLQFAYVRGNSSQERKHMISLPQFSAAAVPKGEEEAGNTKSAQSSGDFVMNVGGPVWALDWCPRIDPVFARQHTCEFIAVASHSPGSSYHKIGEPLFGRGIIQIWCLLDDGKEKNSENVIPFVNVELSQPRRGRGRPRKHNSNDVTPLVNVESSQPRRGRGRPRKQNAEIISSQPKKVTGTSRKKPVTVCETVQHPNEDIELLEAIATELPENFPDLSLPDDIPLLAYNDDIEPSEPISGPCFKFYQNPEEALEEIRTSGFEIPGDVALPRLVLCLAHNGKVAWDAKWRPSCNHHNKSKHRMGYLAVLLGSGALEVWEVLLPQTMKALYSACQTKKTVPEIDPRFIMLEPVFKCSKLMQGGRQSIPITIEWSTSSQHDRILVGCHDGTVAMWNFSANSPCTDTRPTRNFSADTGPIRALAWAPSESNDDNSDIILSAGHRGLKFWNLSDPYKTLWDFPVQRIIYSLDWLRDLRCIVFAFDDGTLRILSLPKAANNVHVTGEPFAGTPQQGFHSYYCSSFAIWSVHVSRLTGMVAYCGADGNVLCFELTSRAVEVDPLRNRARHYLCGNLSEENSVFTVGTPLPDAQAFPMKKSLNEWSSAPRTIRGFVSVSNQAKREKEKIKYPTRVDDGRALETQHESEGALRSGKKLKHQGSTSGHGGEKYDETGAGTDSFPPKSVAMHRVRWNMNKGSEGWLCYGGAAGILRCQNIR